MTAQLHAAAVIARLTTSGAPPLKVFDGRVPDKDPATGVLPVPPYVLVRFDFVNLSATARPDASDLTLRSRAFQVTARVYSVATTAAGVRALQNRVSVALLDWSLAVAGRNCSPMRHIDTFGPPPDEDTGTDYFEAGDDYRFTSHPA
jgi:hypothetical protein